MKRHLSISVIRTISSLLLALALAGCERRETQRTPGGIARTDGIRQSELQPGMPVPTAAMQNPYANNPSALAEGKRLYHWYNCSGCHFAGGGGIGPPLMDDDWIYGDAPQNILASIIEGRPEGMPSYRGKLPQDHALKIVAYVRSLREDRAEEAGREAVAHGAGETRQKGSEEHSPPFGRPAVEQEAAVEPE